MLLEPKILKVLKRNDDGAVLHSTIILVLESKTYTHDDLLGPTQDNNVEISGSTVHHSGFVDFRHKVFNPLLVKMAQGLRLYIALLIHYGIDNLISQDKCR